MLGASQIKEFDVIDLRTKVVAARPIAMSKAKTANPINLPSVLGKNREMNARTVIPTRRMCDEKFSDQARDDEQYGEGQCDGRCIGDLITL